MCTMPDAARAAKLATGEPKLGVGIHLCLTQGTPLAGELRVLAKAGANGQAASLNQSVPELLHKLQWYRAARNEARREWQAQIEFALAAGIKPTHLDSHKHVHHWPLLQNIIIDLAKTYQIPAIRCAREINPGAVRSGAGYRILSLLARKLAKKLGPTSIQTTDWFYGLAATGAFSEQHWLAILDRLPSGIGEIMIHPGKIEDVTASSTRLVEERELEWRGVTAPSVRQAVSDRQILLHTFAGLPSKTGPIEQPD